MAALRLAMMVECTCRKRLRSLLTRHRPLSEDALAQAYGRWIEKYGWWIRPNRTVGGLYVGGLYCRWIESSAGWIEAMSARRIEKCWASGLRSVGPVD